MTNVKKHNNNQYSNMKNFKAATILWKKEGRKERKKQKTKTESVPMTKRDSAAPPCY